MQITGTMGALLVVTFTPAVVAAVPVVEQILHDLRRKALLALP
jgi:hypothetical protein